MLQGGEQRFLSSHSTPAAMLPILSFAAGVTFFKTQI